MRVQSAIHARLLNHLCKHTAHTGLCPQVMDFMRAWSEREEDLAQAPGFMGVMLKNVAAGVFEVGMVFCSMGEKVCARQLSHTGGWSDWRRAAAACVVAAMLYIIYMSLISLHAALDHSIRCRQRPCPVLYR